MMAMLKLNPVFLDFDDIHELSNSKNTPNIKVLILNNPHNPTGKVFTRNELETVASFVKNRIFLLLLMKVMKNSFMKKNLSIFEQLIKV